MAAETAAELLASADDDVNDEGNQELRHQPSVSIKPEGNTSVTGLAVLPVTGDGDANTKRSVVVTAVGHHSGEAGSMFWLFLPLCILKIGFILVFEVIFGRELNHLQTNVLCVPKNLKGKTTTITNKLRENAFLY